MNAFSYGKLGGGRELSIRRFSERSFSGVNVFELSEKKSPSGNEVKTRFESPLCTSVAQCRAVDRSFRPMPVAKGAQVETCEIFEECIVDKYVAKPV